MENKMTNVKALTYVLDNCDLPEDVREKVEKILTSAQKKVTSKKPEGLNEEKSAHAEAILAVMEHGVEYTTSEIGKLVPALNGKTTQYISPLLKYLAKQGDLVRLEGRTTKYRLAD